MCASFVLFNVIFKLVLKYAVQNICGLFGIHTPLSQRNEFGMHGDGGK